MNQSATLTGESLDHKIGAIFDDEAQAKAAAEKLNELEGLSGARILVVGPGDKNPGWELEPEDKGIWRTLVLAHVKLGLVGAAVGLALYILLMTGLGVGFVINNPLFSALAIIAICALLGMMVGGLLTLRPDHDMYITAAQEALRGGKYVVAVHGSSHDQVHTAKAELDKLSGKTFSSF